MDTHQTLRERKWRLEKSEEEGVWLLHGSRPKSFGQINFATTIYKMASLPLRITKMPLLGLKFDSFT